MPLSGPPLHEEVPPQVGSITVGVPGILFSVNAVPLPQEEVGVMLMEPGALIPSQSL